MKRQKFHVYLSTVFELLVDFNCPQILYRAPPLTLAGYFRP